MIGLIFYVCVFILASPTGASTLRHRVNDRVRSASQRRAQVSDCLAADPVRQGCSIGACEQLVCSSPGLASCCNDNWYSLCVAKAREECMDFILPREISVSIAGDRDGSKPADSKQQASESSSKGSAKSSLSVSSGKGKGGSSSNGKGSSSSSSTKGSCGKNTPEIPSGPVKTFSAMCTLVLTASQSRRLQSLLNGLSDDDFTRLESTFEHFYVNRLEDASGVLGLVNFDLEQVVAAGTVDSTISATYTAKLTVRQDSIVSSDVELERLLSRLVNLEPDCLLEDIRHIDQRFKAVKSVTVLKSVDESSAAPSVGPSYAPTDGPTSSPVEPIFCGENTPEDVVDVALIGERTCKEIGESRSPDNDGLCMFAVSGTNGSVLVSEICRFECIDECVRPTPEPPAPSTFPSAQPSGFFEMSSRPSDAPSDIPSDLPSDSPSSAPTAP